MPVAASTILVVVRVTPSRSRPRHSCWIPVLDSDVELDDLQDDDTAFEPQEKDLKPRKKAYEVEYKVYSPQDIQAQQDRQVDEAAGLLEQPKETTAIPLRFLRWNKGIECSVCDGTRE